MRFSYAETMTDPTYYVPLARAAEEAGYDSFVVPDSVAYPKFSDAVYPFNPDGTREFLEDKPFIDPFVLAAALAVVTSKIRFVTFVLKLPIRHPVLVAKQAASVAVMSGGRLGLGVGTSPWPEDYELCDVPWEGRGKRMDEAMQIISGLTSPAKEGSDRYFEFHGEIFDVPAVKMSPVPDDPIPLLVGGHGEPALRRAARVGDGWMHGGGNPDELPGLLSRLSELRAEAGRSNEPFEVHVISMDAYSVDGVRRLEDQGVTDVIVGFRWPYGTEKDTESLDAKIDNLRRFADNVIASAR
jgi:probable F420-dependent oxidoreductase